MAEANAENSLVQGRQSLQQSDQSADPRVVAVSVVAATRNHKSVVVGYLIICGELTGSHTETIPSLAFFAQHSDEHSEVSSVFHFNVFRIICAKKQRKSLHSHPPFLHNRSWISCWGDPMWRRTFPSLNSDLVQREKERRGKEKGRRQMGSCQFFISHLFTYLLEGHIRCMLHYIITSIFLSRSEHL